MREKRRFILAAGHTAHGFGLGRLAGRIYALLFLAARSLSLDEISDELKISKASASITLRRLAAWKLVQRVPLPESRRDFYRAEGDFSRVIRDGILPLIQAKLNSAGAMLESLMCVAPTVEQTKGSQEGADSQESLNRRIREAKALQEKLSLILNSGLAAKFL